MFSGATNINLDAKGRIAIPSRFREEIQQQCGRQMYITVAVDEKCRGEEGCLWLYPLPVWRNVENTILGLKTLNKTVQKLRRFFIGNAVECEMDAQGRLLIPENLRSMSSLEKKVVIVGQLEKFEIWNADAWERKKDEWINGDDTEGLDEIGDISF